MKRSDLPRAHFVGSDGVAICGVRPFARLAHDGLLCQRCEVFLIGYMTDLGLAIRPPRHPEPIGIRDFIKEEK